MYETMTYEAILKRALGRISTDVDKREGSILYDALAPAAAELAQMYLELDVILNETFADTASREYLIKRAAERGISPYSATKMIGKGVFNVDVPIGSRFSGEKFNFVVFKKISSGVFQMKCETAGQEPNEYLGKLVPIQYINGLEKAELVELLIPGEEEEPTEQLRQRYFNSLNAQSYGGNQKDYIEKVSALPGVGGVKVYPVWKGGGTVKLVIVGSNYKKPTDVLIEAVQTAVDPVTNGGEGMGIAPIGHVVTVVGATEAIVNVQLSITYHQGWNWSALQEQAETVIQEYFSELNRNWSQMDTIIVRTSQIETRLLELSGVLDIAHTKLNGIEENLVLKAEEIAVRGEIVG